MRSSAENVPIIAVSSTRSAIMNSFTRSFTASHAEDGPEDDGGGDRHERGVALRVAVLHAAEGAPEEGHELRRPVHEQAVDERGVDEPPAPVGCAAHGADD